MFSGSDCLRDAMEQEHFCRKCGQNREAGRDLCDSCSKQTSAEQDLGDGSSHPQQGDGDCCGSCAEHAGSTERTCWVQTEQLPRHLSTTSCNLTPRRCLHARMMRVWASGRLACTQSGLCHMSRHHRMQSPPPHLHKQHMRMMTMMQTKTSIRRFRLHGQSGPQHSTALRGTANVPSTASRLPRSSILQI